MPAPPRPSIDVLSTDPFPTDDRPLVVRVVPDVAGLDGKAFDYSVPAPMRDRVRIGTIVRVPFHGRRTRGWVVALDVQPPEGVVLKAVAKVSGWGPPAEVIDLAWWTAWRWAGRVVHLLDTASPPKVVAALPPVGRGGPPRTADGTPPPMRALPGAAKSLVDLLAAEAEAKHLVAPQTPAQDLAGLSKSMAAAVPNAADPSTDASDAAAPDGADLCGADVQADLRADLPDQATPGDLEPRIAGLAPQQHAPLDATATAPTTVTQATGAGTSFEVGDTPDTAGAGFGDWLDDLLPPIDLTPATKPPEDLRGGGDAIGAGAGGQATPAETETEAPVEPGRHRVATVELPPGDDPAALALAMAAAVAATGPLLVIAASAPTARHIARQLHLAGEATAWMPRDWANAAAGGYHAVGTRAAAWAPVSRLGAVLVVDEHDDLLAEERSPTWHAREVAVERARRADVPVVLLSPVPSLEARVLATPIRPDASWTRAGWPKVDVVDRRREDPRTAGLLSARLATLLHERDRGRVVCVLNRTGRSRLLGCASCGEVARCERCDASVTQPAGTPMLVCARCAEQRVVVCTSCGGAKFKNLRAGVNRVREELEALAGEPVGELTATVATGLEHRIVVGTEAVLHRIPPPVGVVAFLDLDQELLAPRLSATAHAMALLSRAGRLLGGRAGHGRPGDGRLLLQTRDPSHPVIESVLHTDPVRWAAAEAANRHVLRFPPFAALAAVSGAGAATFIEGQPWPAGIDVLGPDDDRWLLRAGDAEALANALAPRPRPPERLRIEVDPTRL